MNFNKITNYLLFQTFKNFLLITFIFLSVAWLLQITRLFTITNFIHIDVIEIITLSFYLIPNLITVIVPFILIFGLLLCFVKLKRDNELIAILSLGYGLNPLRNSLIFFCLIIISIFAILSFYLAPKVYGIYKYQEYELRNTLDFKRMSFSNFLNINKNTILDFKKKNNKYEDIFISFEDENENIIYAKSGNIFSKNNQYNFQLIDGFKISIDKDDQIEKLEFLNYILKIDNKNLKDEKILDKNTLTIFDDYKLRNYLNISFKFFDVILIIFIICFFYINNLKSINFKTLNNIYFASSSISILIINQILKNSEIVMFNYFFYLTIIIIFCLVISKLLKKYE